MFLALCMVLPIITAGIPTIGNMLIPMHIPVLLCGLLCGWQYGLVIGFISPLMRSLTFGMPPMYPVAIAMVFELATYGLVIGLLYGWLKKHNIVGVYISLLSARALGRVVWGLAELILLGIKGNVFTFHAFISGALLTAVPGIVIQLALIPVIWKVVDVEK